MWNVLRSRSSATMAEATERNALEVERPTAEAPMKNATMRIFASTGLKLTTKFFTMKGMMSSVSEVGSPCTRARPMRPMSMVPVQTMPCRTGVM